MLAKPEHSKSLHLLFQVLILSFFLHKATKETALYGDFSIDKFTHPLLCCACNRYKIYWWRMDKLQIIVCPPPHITVFSFETHENIFSIIWKNAFLYKLLVIISLERLIACIKHAATAIL